MKLTKEQKYGIAAVVAVGLIWYFYKKSKENSTKIDWENAKKVGISTTILEGKLLGKKASDSDIKKMESAYDNSLPKVKEAYYKLNSEEQKAIAWAFNYSAKKLNSWTDTESAKKFDDSLNDLIKNKFPKADISIVTNFMKNGK
jgi:hypothetical protein